MQYILVTISNTRLQKNLQLWVSSEKRFGELVAHIEEGKKLVIKPLDVSRSYVDHLLVFPTLDPAYLLKELAHKPELLTPFVVWMAKLLRIVSNSYLDGRDAVWITEVLGNHRKEAIYVD